MLTRPAGLSDDELQEVIERAWNVAADSLEYRPVGFGSHHWVATEGTGLQHFVTVDELAPGSRSGDEISALGMHLRPALEAATQLRAAGCRFVVAPISTSAGDPFVQFDDFAVALYPFIGGRSFSYEDSFAGADRDQILECVAGLHTVPIDAIRVPHTDRFVVPWLDELSRSTRPTGRPSGPYSMRASQLLIEHEAEIRELVARYRSLVIRYQRDPGPVVVTHGEIHPGNVMKTPNGWVIVDWDTLLLAPPERDLWRLAPADGSVLHTYTDATGREPLDWLIDLYAVRWDLADIASFAAVFRNPHDDTEDSRKALGMLHSVVGRLGG